jgi:hypothetical protein
MWGQPTESPAGLSAGSKNALQERNNCLCWQLTLIFMHSATGKVKVRANINILEGQYSCCAYDFRMVDDRPAGIWASAVKAAPG